MLAEFLKKAFSRFQKSMDLRRVFKIFYVTFFFITNYTLEVLDYHKNVFSKYINKCFEVFIIKKANIRMGENEEKRSENVPKSYYITKA